MNDDRQCPNCCSRLRVRTSVRVGDQQQQYLKCQCGYERTALVPVSSIWQRAKGQRGKVDVIGFLPNSDEHATVDTL
jgi:hypothetical protein